MKKQQGSVLIITVVVLFAATMISLYAMRGTIFQDKMTANINNKVMTINAAEDGATQFLNWLNGQFKASGGGWPTGTTQQNWNTSASIPNTNSGTLTVNSGNNGYYWIDSSKHPVGCTSNPCWDNTNKIVTVNVTGNLIKTSGSTTKILGESIYQIKIKGQFPGAVKLPDLPAALTLGGTVSSFAGKQSNNFKIDGQNKLSIATMNSSAQTVLNGITHRNDSDHYSGGADCPTGSGACVKNTDLGIWGDANKVMELVESIKNAPGVTYIEGDVIQHQLGQKVPSCAGIVIIRGNYTPTGNNCDFKGVMLILGGSFNGSGGGNTAIRGAIYVADIQGSSPGTYSFGNASTDISGGGNMSITYDASFLGGDPNDPFAGSGPIETTVLAWNDVL